MTLSIGDTVPDVTLITVRDGGPTPVQSKDVLGSGTVVLFGVPGAFTPACSDQHLPEYVLRAGELRAKGVDTIACVAVNDAFVMDAWGKSREVGGKILMLGDGNGDFAKAVGLTMDGSGFGLGMRSQRYAAVLENGVVKSLWVEEKPTDVTVSSADAVLKSL
ncbi:peroxiredoxin [Pseudonocardia sp. RS11V-5]|uniref:peroxiredoxin n=1 Tax=Pseudonocardia terrae TaxID=2905831 RepID=UPI001E28F365|nr:peroxiredoxin [Pseudonocardia terrae]MCE3553609.1 peroxiredoxin [Pseudonocardia terrae]